MDTVAHGRLGALIGTVSDLVPGLVEQLITAHPGRVYREALAVLEKPLLVHALRLTGGSQLRAARLLGVNRNTLRKRCRELGLATSRATRMAVRPPISI
jgi:two-component system, NtrC family, nitrogen regulation response regulator GlnG